MSIASEITRLQVVKSDILQAINDKGVVVPAGSALNDCPDLIASIPTGGGGSRVRIGSYEYPYVQIGNQFWLAENFHEPLGQYSYSSAFYQDSPGSYGIYGLLYRWDAICVSNETMSGSMRAYLTGEASGWRVPSNNDWIALRTYLGTDPGTKIKSKNWDGTDDYGFNAMPSGYRNSEGYRSEGSVTSFWSSTEISSSDANNFGTRTGYSGLSGSWGTNKAFMFAVRLVKDA